MGRGPLKLATGDVFGAILWRVLDGSTKGTVNDAAGKAAVRNVANERNAAVEHRLLASALITVTLMSTLSIRPLHSD